MKEFLNKHWNNILSWGIGLLIGILINIPTCNKPKPEIEYIPVHDTVTIEKERIVEHTKPIFVTDTFIKVDSILIEKDGTYVELPVIWSQYKDTIKNDSSEAYIEINHHGVVSEIDRIHLDYKYNKEIQTIVKEPKKVGLVWYIGFDFGFGGQLGIKNNVVDFNYGPQAGIHAGIGIGGTIK